MGLQDHNSPLKIAKQDSSLPTTVSDTSKLPCAQLFEGPLGLTQGQILTHVSFSFIQKHFPV